MGATQWQTIYKVLVPAAKIGIIDAIILGMGRAIGETMAVLMVVGNAPQFFPGVGEPIATLTSQIVMDMPYSTGTHRTALFGMAVILFLISMVLVARGAPALEVEGLADGQANGQQHRDRRAVGGGHHHRGRARARSSSTCSSTASA